MTALRHLALSLRPRLDRAIAGVAILGTAGTAVEAGRMIWSVWHGL